MDQPFAIVITNERRTQRNRILEFQVHPRGEHNLFLAIATLYGSTDLYLNLPANSDATAFIRWLNQHLGEPVEPPVVKCSAQWSEHMVGPMQTVTWKLEPEGLDQFDMLFQ